LNSSLKKISLARPGCAPPPFQRTSRVTVRCLFCKHKSPFSPSSPPICVHAYGYRSQFVPVKGTELLSRLAQAQHKEEEQQQQEGKEEEEDGSERKQQKMQIEQQQQQRQRQPVSSSSPSSSSSAALLPVHHTQKRPLLLFLDTSSVIKMIELHLLRQRVRQQNQQQQASRQKQDRKVPLPPGPFTWPSLLDKARQRKFGTHVPAEDRVILILTSHVMRELDNHSQKAGKETGMMIKRELKLGDSQASVIQQCREFGFLETLSATAPDPSATAAAAAGASSAVGGAAVRGEMPNTANDSKILQMTLGWARVLGENADVVLVTDDRFLAERARSFSDLPVLNIAQLNIALHKEKQPLWTAELFRRCFLTKLKVDIRKPRNAQAPSLLASLVASATATPNANASPARSPSPTAASTPSASASLNAACLPASSGDAATEANGQLNTAISSPAAAAAAAGASEERSDPTRAAVPNQAQPEKDQEEAGVSSAPVAPSSSSSSSFLTAVPATKRSDTPPPLVPAAASSEPQQQQQQQQQPDSSCSFPSSSSASSVLPRKRPRSPEPYPIKKEPGTEEQEQQQQHKRPRLDEAEPPIVVKIEPVETEETESPVFLLPEPPMSTSVPIASSSPPAPPESSLSPEPPSVAADTPTADSLEQVDFAFALASAIRLAQQQAKRVS